MAADGSPQNGGVRAGAGKGRHFSQAPQSASTGKTVYDRAYYEKRLEDWEEQLLDFSMRNKLLNVQTTSRGGALSISEPSLDEVWRELVVLEHQLAFVRRTRRDYAQELAEYNEYLARLRAGELGPYDRRVPEPAPFVLKDKELSCDLSADDMNRRLRSIRQRARTLADERGIDALYLAFGVVRWKEEPSGKEHAAPLVLVPVELFARGRRAAATFRLKLAEGDAQGNATFALYAKRTFDVAMPEFKAAAFKTDLKKYFQQVAVAVEKKGWKVEQRVVLSVFSFATISMYYDLVNNGSKIVSHPVVRAICNDRAKLTESERCLPTMAEIDRRVLAFNPNDAYQVVDADSSQARAIEMANAGYSFVLQGPPGTGKSQTITNIISEALAQGKSVLFVSEKRAALDVVYRRLEQAGLGDFVFVLHDMKQNKKEAIKGLAEQLDRAARTPQAFPASVVRAYEKDKRQLDAYARDMVDAKNPLGRSVWDVCDQLVRLRTAPRLSFELQDVDELSAAAFEDMQDTVSALADALAALSCAAREHPWYGVRPRQITEDYAADAARVVRAYAAALDGVQAELQAVSKHYGIVLDARIGVASSVCQLATELDGVSLQGIESLLGADDVDQVERSLERLQESAAAHQGGIEAFHRVREQVFPGVRRELTRASLDGLILAVEDALREDALFARWAGMEERRLYDEAQELVAAVDEARSARAAILQDYREDIFALDSRSLLMSFERDFASGFKRLFSQEYKQQLRALEHCRRAWSQEALSYEEACALLHQLDEVNACLARLEERGAAWSGDFPGIFCGIDTDTGELQRRIVRYQELIGARVAVQNLRSVVDVAERDLSIVAAAFQLDACDLETDFSQLARAVRNAQTLREAARLCGVEERALAKLVLEGGVPALAALRAAVDEEARARIAFQGLFAVEGLYDSDHIDAARGFVGRCLESIGEIEPAARYARRRQACCDLGLRDFVEKAEQAAVAPERLSAAFARRVNVLWLEAAQRRYPSVAEFSRVSHERVRQDFCAYDTRLTKASEVQVQSALVKALRRAQSLPAAGTLRREAGKRTHVMSVREAFAKMPELITLLKPCVMMSPLSVSAFLEARSITFDLVVFDEASQVCTANAIGAISRGRQIIIAGDSKQLPPTSFFAASNAPDEEDEEDDEENADAALADAGDFESVLEEAGGLQSVSLRWHYRSRNESLISFSNRELYQGKLETFPSSYEQRKSEGVSFAYVPDGVWLGSNKGNPVEARRVARLVFEHLRDFPERSLGVIAFGSKQADLIEREVNRLRDQNPSFDHFFDEDKDECFFVKNLENVQGDERDSIILAVGYGKGADGKLSQRFGPINLKGGERRLNVAVTRAKHDLVLVSSILETDFAAEPRSRGPQLLRDYLYYARVCDASLRVPGARDDELADPLLLGLDAERGCSWLAAYIEEELVARHYAVDRSIGASTCRIDIGVKLAASETDYVAGITFDGPAYASEQFTRARERIRPGMLEAMGWHLYRVWAQDWQRDPEGSLAALLGFLKPFGEPHDDATAAATAPVDVCAASLPVGETVSAEPASAPAEPAGSPIKPVHEATVPVAPRASATGSTQKQRGVTAPAAVGADDRARERRAAETAHTVAERPAASQSSASARRSAAAAPPSPAAASRTPASASRTAATSSATSTRVPAPVIQAPAAPATSVQPRRESMQAEPTPAQLKAWGLDKLETDENGFIAYVEADKSAYQKVDAYLVEVLRVESPINVNEVNRLLKAFNPRVQSSWAKETLKTVLQRDKGEEFMQVAQGKGGMVIYATGKPLHPRRGGSRPFNYIPDEELDLGMVRVLARLSARGPVDKDYLFEKTSEAFGFKRLDGGIHLKLEDSLQRLVGSGTLSLDKNQGISPAGDKR